MDRLPVGHAACVLQGDGRVALLVTDVPEPRKHHAAAGVLFCATLHLALHAMVEEVCVSGSGSG